MLRFTTFLAFCFIPAFTLVAQEKSVKPGINDRFENPDVAEFVERFERDGRDAYDHRKEVLAALDLKPGMVVADVGAGTGLFTRLFSPLVGKEGKVYAVDISDEFVAHIERLAKQQKQANIVGVVCDPDNVKLAPNSVDLVYICDTYHHFEFPQKTMASIHKALKPDGQVVLIDFIRKEGVSSEWILGHVRAGQEVFTQEIEDAGFKQIDEEKGLLKESYFVRFEKVAEESPKKLKKLTPLPDKAPAPKDNPTTPAKVELGKMLFFDPRLSGNNQMSCATCHIPAKAFADGLTRSLGANNEPLERNTPSCLNVGFYESYFWDGRASSLEEQALVPIQSAKEMNQGLDELEAELAAIPGYVDQFQMVFEKNPNRQDIAKALAAFQRTLITEPSPFDKYLAGDKDAISEEAKEGFELFQGSAGCAQCHNGPLLSDGQFYRLGASSSDEGRGKLTRKREDRFRFRTPSLRNVANTAPYMHNGSMKTLDDVVTFYYRGVPPAGPDGLNPDVDALVGQSFSEIPPIVEFLETLSGKSPDITPPNLP